MEGGGFRELGKRGLWPADSSWLCADMSSEGDLWYHPRGGCSSGKAVDQMFLEKGQDSGQASTAEPLFSAIGSIKGVPNEHQCRSLQGFFVWGDFCLAFYPAASHDCRHRPLKALFLVIMVFLPVGLPNKRNRRWSGLGRHVWCHCIECPPSVSETLWSPFGVVCSKTRPLVSPGISPEWEVGALKQQGTVRV